MGTFQNDSSAALLPIMAAYNVSSLTVVPVGALSSFVVAPQPTIITPSSTTSFSLGWNIGGTWATNSGLMDTMLDVPQFVKDATALTPWRYVRMWDTSNNVTAPVNTSVAQKLAAAGARVILTYNLQNSPTRCKVPTTPQIQSWCNGLASASASGVWGIELINEHDFSDYCTDTSANVARLFQVAGPILHSKGYQVIGSNCLNSLGMYSDSTVQNILKGNVDFIGRHGYAATADVALGDYTKVKKLADSLGLGFCCTEVGLNTYNPTELMKLWTGVKALGGIYCGFTFYPWSGGASKFPNHPYSAPGVMNPGNFAAYQSALGGAA